MSSTAPARAIVFDRIDANRRRTRVLVAAFVAALFPAVAWVSSYLAVWAMMLLPSVMDLVEADSGPAAYAAVVAAIAAGLVAGALYLQYRHADAIVLRLAKARPLDRDKERTLWNVVDALCLGIGLPPPKVYVAETAMPNAFAVGRDPGRSSLVVTRGLLSLLSRSELEGVVAHELFHIGNRDIMLNTTVAALSAVLQLPLRLVAAPFGFLFRMHWFLGTGALAWFAGMLWLAFAGLGLLLDEAEMEPLRTIAFVQTSFVVYVFAVAPLVGLLLRRCISRDRESLADADAALLTRNPPALARALGKITGAGVGPVKGAAALAHLFTVDPLAVGRSWWSALFSSHPPVQDRISKLAAMGDGIVPDRPEDADPAANRPGTLGPVATESPDPEVAGLAPASKAGLLDAALYGIAAGTVGIAAMTVLDFAAMLLAPPTAASGAALFMPFNLPGALAAGFSARKKGASGFLSLGMAILVFLFGYLLLVPIVVFFPGPGRDPPALFLASVLGNLVLVVGVAFAGAAWDKWPALIGKILARTLKR